MEPTRIRFVLALGNPGVEYVWTRHNAGWIFADWAVGSPRAFSKELPQGLVARAHGLVWIKPLTWMNRSGEIIPDLRRRFPGWTAEATLVVYDEVALPLGRARLRLRGSAGGHRGMASIIARVGETIPRLRIGIGPRPPEVPLRDFVLEPFREEELDRLMARFPRWLEGIRLLASGEPHRAMQWINAPGDHPGETQGESSSSLPVREVDHET